MSQDNETYYQVVTVGQGLELTIRAQHRSLVSELMRHKSTVYKASK